MLFLAAAVVAARFDEAGEEAVQAEESIRDQRVEDERKDGISYKCGDAEREEDKGDHCGCKQQQSRDQQPFFGGTDTVVQTFILAQQTGRGDRQKEQRGDAEQEPEQDTQEKQGREAENEDRKDDTKHKADDDRDRVITFRVLQDYGRFTSGAGRFRPLCKKPETQALQGFSDVPALSLIHI